MKFINICLLALVAMPAATAFSIVGPSSAARTTALPMSSLVTAEGGAAWSLPSIGQAPGGSSGLVRCEGASRKTFEFVDSSRDTIQLAMTTQGRQLRAVMELWIGPDWTPYKMETFSDDGIQFPVQTLVGTRNKVGNLELRNVGPSEMPFSAACAYAPEPMAEARAVIPETTEGNMVQGGAVYTAVVEAGTKQVRVFLNTDTLQLNCRIELLNGPNNIKQSFEIFTNNGLLNSFYAVFNTPAADGYTVRITNTAPLEFPSYAYIAPVY